MIPLYREVRWVTRSEFLRIRRNADLCPPLHPSQENLAPERVVELRLIEESAQ